MSDPANDAMHADPKNCTRGPFKMYFAHYDQRLIVRKHVAWAGWTINMAHSAAPVIMLAVLVLPTLFVAFAPKIQYTFR